MSRFVFIVLMCFVQVESVHRPNESGEGDSREQRHRVKGERRVELVDGTGAVGVRYRYRVRWDGSYSELSENHQND